MGWAGPAQPTGPDSAQNCWADLGPKKIFSSGPDPTQNTGLGRKTGLGRIRPAQIKTGGGGINFPPPTSACRTLFVLHAEKKKKT